MSLEQQHSPRLSDAKDVILQHLHRISVESGVGVKRGRAPDAVGDLQQHSKQLRMLGQDPLPASLHQAQLAGLHQGQFSQVRPEYAVC